MEESHLPVEQKTIKPVDVGGVAGGVKFLHNGPDHTLAFPFLTVHLAGVFLKFVADFHNLYGSDGKAMKVAGCEVLGLRAYRQLSLPSVRLNIRSL